MCQRIISQRYRRLLFPDAKENPVFSHKEIRPREGLHISKLSFSSGEGGFFFFFFWDEALVVARSEKKVG